MTKFLYEVGDNDLAARVQHDLERFATTWQKDGASGTSEPIDAFCDVMLRGGKRLRGMLAMQSYHAHGGENETVAIGSARVFEILQTSLLVVDDIADRSVLRRGGPSAHTRLETYAQKNNMKGDALHYGQAQAMNVAYAGLHKATTELLELSVSAEIAAGACKRLHENILMTINGQINDIFNEATRGDVSEDMIENVLACKTPYYTILGPIELGAQLAGAKLSRHLYDYSIHAGIAYQIADDIISTFGTEDETGKGTNDDIREGKLTLLAYYALANSLPTYIKTLKKTLGNPDASHEECDAVRAIFQASGALDYAKSKLARREEQALGALKADKKTDPAFVDHLKKLTDYVVRRRS